MRCSSPAQPHALQVDISDAPYPDRYVELVQKDQILQVGSLADMCPTDDDSRRLRGSVRCWPPPGQPPKPKP
jgi:hypothetical protein